MSVQTQPRLDMTIGPLSLTFVELQFPSSNDYWDANWLVVDISCSDLERTVQRLNDPCLRTDEMRDLKDDLSAFVAGGSNVSLKAMEPYFSFEIHRMENASTVEIRAGIRQRHAKEADLFDFQATDQALSELVFQLEGICLAYPVKGSLNVH